jgi:hypothetical protein
MTNKEFQIGAFNSVSFFYSFFLNIEVFVKLKKKIIKIL